MRMYKFIINNISIMILIFLFSSKVMFANELKFELNNYIKGVKYYPGLYDLSNNNRYFMRLCDYDFNNSICDVIDIISKTEILSVKLPKSIIPFKISDDGHHAVCQYNNKIALINLDNNSIKDSFMLSYCAYSDSILIGHPIINEIENTNIIRAINIYNNMVLDDYSLPNNYKSRQISIAKYGSHYSVLCDEGNSKTVIIRDILHNRGTLIKSVFDGYMEISPNSKYFIYSTNSNSIIVYNLENDQKNLIYLDANFSMEYNGCHISDDDRFLIISFENFFKIYNLETLEIYKKLTSKFPFKSMNGSYSFWNSNKSFIYGKMNQFVFSNVNIENTKQSDFYTNKFYIRYNYLDLITSKFNDYVSIISDYENIDIDFKYDTLMESSYGYLNRTKEFHKSGYYFSVETKLYSFDYNTNQSYMIMDLAHNLKSICRLPDTNYIAVSYNNTINIINLKDKSIVNTLTTDYNNQSLSNLRVSLDKQYLFAGQSSNENGDNIVIKWNLNNLSNNPSCYYNVNSNPNMYISHDNRYLLNILEYRQLLNMETNEFETLEWIKYHDNETEPLTFKDCGFSHDGKYIFAVADKRLFVWDYKTKKHIKTYMSETEFVQMRISNVSNTLFAFKKDNTFEVLKYEDEAGVFDIHTNKGMKSYITQNNNVLTIEADCSIDTYFELFDVAGSIISSNYNCIINDRGIEFAAVGLATGTYFLNIKNNKTTNTFKIMVIGE